MPINFSQFLARWLALYLLIIVPRIPILWSEYDSHYFYTSGYHFLHLGLAFLLLTLFALAQRLGRIGYFVGFLLLLYTVMSEGGEEMMRVLYNMSYGAIFFSQVTSDAAKGFVLTEPLMCFLAVLACIVVAALPIRFFVFRVSNKALIWLCAISAILFPFCFRRVHIKHLAPILIVREGIRFYSRPDRIITLSDVEKARAKQFGFIIAPPRTPDPIPQNKKLNIIIILLESFQKNFLSHVNPKYPGLTPQLDAFAKDSIFLENFYNSSFPTANALFSGQCSDIVYLGRSLSVFDQFPRYCLPDYLKDLGYENVYLSSSWTQHSNINFFLKNKGFTTIIDADDYEILKPAYKTNKGHWGIHDYDFTSEMLLYLKARQSIQPLFLFGEFIDTHWPGYASDKCKKYHPTDEMLNSIHCTDQAFGRFIAGLKELGEYDNSILFVFGDHPLPTAPRGEAADLFNGHYDRVAAFVRAPSLRPHASKTISYTADLAPTILDLLGTGTKEMFAGKSIFSTRKDYPHLYGFDYVVSEKGLRREVGNECAHDLTQIEIPSPAHGYDLTKCQRLKLIRALDKFIPF